MGKEKVVEFEVFRAFAIIAVVLIHSTSRGVTVLDHESMIYWVFYFLNKISLFAVPSFIFMSGVVLFYTYYDKWKPKDIIPFYMKRLKFILVPYLVVSLLYYIFNQRLYYDSWTIDWGHFLMLLPLGHAGFHLYYIIIILQFYFLFPFLIFLVKKYPLVKRYFALIGLGLYLAFYMVNKFYYQFPYRPTMCFTYFIFFFLGASVGMNYKKALAVLIKYRVWVSAIALAAGLGVVGYYFMADLKRVGPGYLFDLSFNAYGAFASLFMVWL
ncbi:MAG: acyltransferase, partial [Gorillibacterium sp.]|nr:acyltransferase [Gorillibacterium sp.]